MIDKNSRDYTKKFILLLNDYTHLIQNSLNWDYSTAISDHHAAFFDLITYLSRDLEPAQINLHHTEIFILSQYNRPCRFG